jgi:hypothetical protein
VEWTARMRPFFFEYTGPGYFSWSDVDPYSAYEGEGEEVVASGSGTTDAQGRFRIRLPADLGKRPGSQVVILEASVTDLNDNVVAGRTEAVVHAGAFTSGCRRSATSGRRANPSPSRCGRWIGRADRSRGSRSPGPPIVGSGSA